MSFIYSIIFDSRQMEGSDDGFVSGVYSVQFPNSEIQRSGGNTCTCTCRWRRKEPSLVLALGRSFAGTFMMAALFKLLQDLLAFVSPQLLKYAGFVYILHSVLQMI